MDEDEDSTQMACDSLIMCIVTSLNQGLRNGGGIGDVLRKPSSTVSYITYKYSKFYLLHYLNDLYSSPNQEIIVVL